MTEETQKRNHRAKNSAYATRMKIRGLIRINLIVPDDPEVIEDLQKRAKVARQKLGKALKAS